MAFKPTTQKTLMIKIENLSYNIDGKSIVKPLNIEIPVQKLTAIIGPNGAGKSTLLNIIGRLLPLQNGSVYFANTSLKDTAKDELAKIVAIMPQENHIVGRINVAQLLQFGRYPHHKGRPQEKDKAIVEQRLAEFELVELRDRYLEQLSGGQRQRVFLAMVFCQATPFILLDEPLNNLDIFHENNLLRLIKHKVKSEKSTVVTVLHDINHAIAYADNIIALKDGKLVFHGKPQEVITPENIYDLFGVKTEVITHNNRPIVVSEVL